MHIKINIQPNFKTKYCKNKLNIMKVKTENETNTWNEKTHYKK